TFWLRLLFAGEEVHHPLEKAASVVVLRVNICAQCLAQFFEQMPLVLGKLSGDHHLDIHQLVTAPGTRAVAAQPGHTFATQAEDPACLGPGGNRQFDFTIDSRNADDIAESGLCYVDIDVEDNVVVTPPEEFVFLHVNHDVQVAFWRARIAGVAFAAHLDLQPFVDARWNLNVEDGVFAHPPLAVTVTAGRMDHLTAPLALRAGGNSHHRTQKSLLDAAHFAAAVAHGAGYRRRAGF